MFSMVLTTNWFLALVSELLYLPKSKLYPDLVSLPNKSPRKWFKGVADRVEAAFGALDDTEENRRRLRHLFFSLCIPLVDAALLKLCPGIDL